MIDKTTQDLIRSKVQALQEASVNLAEEEAAHEANEETKSEEASNG